MELCVLPKWSYNHDVYSIFQISLKQIGASESFHYPRLMTVIPVDIYGLILFSQTYLILPYSSHKYPSS